ncbi:hypothetical protein R1sor_006960 [Riccia sorocarpa]|uniref:CASP-like protein n=1 Tax=Riccia sorocarpa TaxID=122646 RepID=A0ABD3HRV8_9MARC
MSGNGATDAERGAKPGALSARHGTSPAITVLRLLTFAATLSAFVTMITNKERKLVFGLVPRWSKYHYSKAFLWFVIGNGIAFGYALLATIVGAVVKSPSVTRHLVILDLLVLNIIMAAAAAATAVAYLGKNGLPEAGWGEICSVYERYCHHILGALVASYLGWLFLLIAVLLGIRRS